ncbi:WxL domain-containing protein [Carnobacterium gallinarum]|uniref:WxL domain-containing protein n=1 Tax=Carnobacterium gallinarum TaxID=2749 RepID=UPI00054E28D2|nr:WxL domain-containing protein [Carnobacterium gallinarum]
MKKNKFAMIGFAAIALSVVSFNTVASAVPTNADVQFEIDDDSTIGEVIKPGTPELIITPEEGGSTTGPLRINHVPYMHFGTQKISTAKKVYHPTVERYTEGIEVKYIPHFVQVADARGSMTATWKLTVSGTVFSPTVSTTNPKLNNTYISLDQGTITNNYYDEQLPVETANILSGIGATKIIPTSGGSLDVLQVQAGKNTNSTISSIVLADGYNESTPYTETDLNSGVSLHVPTNDIKVNGEKYESTLTWTLADSI